MSFPAEGGCGAGATLPSPQLWLQPFIFIREVQKEPEQHGSLGVPRRCRSISLRGRKGNLCCFWRIGSSADVMAFQTGLTLEETLGVISETCDTDPSPARHPRFQKPPKYALQSRRGVWWFCWVQ